MATAEELLARTANPENEPHIVIDINRDIVVPVELQNIAVQYDHNIETVIFDCPRYWDGHDLSKMKVFINYMRADSKIGQFSCIDVAPDDTDENIMHFSWTISGNVTEVTGGISFLVCAKDTDENGDLEQRWNSNLNQQMTIKKGLIASGEIEKMAPDVITSMLLRLDELENNGTLHLTPTSVTWDGNEDNVYLSELDPSGYELVGGTVKFINNGTEREVPIACYVNDGESFDKYYYDDAYLAGEYAIATTDDLALGADPLIDVVMWSDGMHPMIYLATINHNPVTKAVGIYADPGDTYMTELKLNAAEFDKRYTRLFSKNIVTDTSLELDGVPADAKAVGNAIWTINNRLTDIESAMDDFSTVEVDSTLSEEGKAADAKAVGDAIDDIRTALEEQSETDAITKITVTEAADGTVTMVNTFESGSTETLVITPNESGNPSRVIYNGTEIQIDWVVEA